MRYPEKVAHVWTCMHKCIPEHWIGRRYKPRAKRPMEVPTIIQARALWTYMLPTPTWRIWDRHYDKGSLHERGWTFVSTPFVGRIRTAFPKVGQTVQILVGPSGIPSARLAMRLPQLRTSYPPPPYPRDHSVLFDFIVKYKIQNKNPMPRGGGNGFYCAA